MDQRACNANGAMSWLFLGLIGVSGCESNRELCKDEQCTGGTSGAYNSSFAGVSGDCCGKAGTASTDLAGGRGGSGGGSSSSSSGGVSSGGTSEFPDGGTGATSGGSGTDHGGTIGGSSADPGASEAAGAGLGGANGSLGGASTSEAGGTAGNAGLSSVEIAGSAGTIGANDYLRATAVESGYAHSCAVLTSGRVACWGLNSDGQLGNASTSDSLVPVETACLERATAVASGSAHTCALSVSGTVYCWGSNAEGQLGLEGIETSNVPIAVTGPLQATAISAGAAHSCAVLTDGSMACWGRNAHGQLGNGTFVSNALPVTVQGITTATSVSLGADYSCAILADKRIQCWGIASNGQLGNCASIQGQTVVLEEGVSSVPYGQSMVPEDTPIPINVISAPKDAVIVSAGTNATCAVATGGTVTCWGLPQLNGHIYTTPLGGRGACDGGKVPDDGYQFITQGSDPELLVLMSGGPLRPQVSVSVGGSHVCVLANDGNTTCWGNGGSPGIPVDAVQYVIDGFAVPNRWIRIGDYAKSRAVAISAGDSHTCALREDGSVMCWGNNGSGQLGNGSTIDASVPSLVIASKGPSQAVQCR